MAIGLFINPPTITLLKLFMYLGGIYLRIYLTMFLGSLIPIKKRMSLVKRETSFSLLELRVKSALFHLGLKPCTKAYKKVGGIRRLNSFVVIYEIFVAFLMLSFNTLEENVQGCTF